MAETKRLTAEQVVSLWGAKNSVLVLRHRRFTGGTLILAPHRAACRSETPLRVAAPVLQRLSTTGARTGARTGKSLQHSYFIGVSKTVIRRKADRGFKSLPLR